ncbi:MAG: acyltransferase family protein [Myxococcota bacterium]
MLEKRPSVGRNLDALDGVRGLAVVLVIASHTSALGMAKQGAAGVWLFFALSAFLLTIPFAANPNAALRPRRLRTYAARRLRRILPGYYFVIFVVFFLQSSDLEMLLRHLVFLEANGIWWTIPQELLFYLVLPLLAASHVWIFRRNIAVTVLGLLFLGAMASLHLDHHVFAIRGNSKWLPFYLGVFLPGMAASYATASPALSRLVAIPGVNRGLNALGLVLLAFPIATAPAHYERFLADLPLVGALGGNSAWGRPGLFGGISALIIYCTVVCKGRLLDRIMSTVALRALGVVSFSLYLVHIVVRDKLEALGLERGTELFLGTLIVGFAIACALYGLVERPFLRRPSPESQPGDAR